ncbi:endonuclease/exonuclease/phosphatase family protein [Phocaeicola sp.]
MKYIGRLLGWILLGINFCMAALLLICAYSPYIDPVAHPVWSCAGLAFPAFLIVNLLFFVFWLVVYRKYALLSLFTFFCCFGAIRTYFPINLSSKDVPQKAIKVLSYNTMAFEHGRPNQKDNPNPVLEYLKNSDADIICLQEYILSNSLKKKDIDYALRAYPYKHYYKMSASNGLGCYSRFPILSAQPIEYESRNNGSIAYKMEVNGDTLLVVNNHLESNKLTEKDKAVYREMMKDPDKHKVSAGSKLLIGKLAEASAIRAAQADTIARVIDDFKGDGVIVCGDFNDSPLSYAHRVIGEKLNDAFVQSGNGFGISYNQNGFYFRIDHILLSKNLESYKCTVDNTIKSSDHYPIWCYVAKK